MSAKQDSDREDRITMEIVVDAYDPDERAMGWYYYLQDHLTFPFRAHCTKTRAISPLQKGDEVDVLDMAPEDECQHEMFVMIRWDRKAGLGVPLSQLQPGSDCNATTGQAMEDWLYWVEMGYEF